jgi:methylated-DNA-protein-cysteine methyltransferase related protein
MLTENLNLTTDFSDRVIEIIQSIPSGKVATYGQIAFLAGNPTASRQVSRLLHAASGKYNLPWQRVINSKGLISLKQGAGYEEQHRLLCGEGIEFDLKDRIDLDRFLWNGKQVT